MHQEHLNDMETTWRFQFLSLGFRVAGRRLEDEKDNERIRREQQAEEARCSWLGLISSFNPGNGRWYENNRTREVLVSDIMATYYIVIMVIIIIILIYFDYHYFDYYDDDAYYYISISIVCDSGIKSTECSGGAKIWRHANAHFMK